MHTFKFGFGRRAVCTFLAGTYTFITPDNTILASTTILITGILISFDKLENLGFILTYTCYKEINKINKYMKTF